MILETTILMFAIALVVVGPALILGYLIYVVWRKLGPNPASATQISFGMVGLLAVVLTLSVITILIMFQLFNNKV